MKDLPIPLVALLWFSSAAFVSAAAEPQALPARVQPEAVEILPSCDFEPPPANPFWHKVEEAPIGSKTYNTLNGLKDPDDVWIGVYEAVEPDDCFLRKISISKTKDNAGRLRLEAEAEIFTEEKGIDCRIKDAIVFKTRPQVFWESDGARPAKQLPEEILVVEEKAVRYEPLIQVKPDKYSRLGKANPGKYFFYSCYLRGFKNNVCIKGRLAKATVGPENSN